MEDKTEKNLRTTGIVLMALTTAMNILGGTGTVCAAFLHKIFPLVYILRPVDYRWLYQVFMIVTILIGLVGIWATTALVRGRNRAYLNAVIVLVVGTIVSGIHFFTSLTLTGFVIPTFMKFLANVITLLVFFIFGLPGVRERVDFSEPRDATTQMTSGGLAAILVGILTLSVKTLVGASHVNEGVNWVDVLKTPLNVSGLILTIGGLVFLLKPLLGRLLEFVRQRYQQTV